MGDLQFGVHLDWGLDGGVFGRGVGCRRGIGICVAGCCVEVVFLGEVSAQMMILVDASRRCCLQSVEIIPSVWQGGNFVEFNEDMWQAHDFWRVLRCESAIFVANAGNCGGARCDSFRGRRSALCMCGGVGV